MPLSSSYHPDPRWLSLPEGFFDRVEPARFPRLTLRYRNQAWAARVGLGDLTEEEWREHMGALVPLPDNLPQGLALRYHGHQFRVYNPELGDGRGFVHAQLRDPIDGRLLDLGTKGSGQTPWSRRGDGRLTLKGGVREALATEMLEALGVYTSKTLSVIETGEALMRTDEPSPTRSCVLVRLSHGHLRFGSFQRLRYRSERDRLGQLLEFACQCYFPVLAGRPAGPELAEELLRQVCRRTAALCASYFAAGFVHGVLNTDNMNLTGESFDYGPYRFAPRYDPAFVAAYFDDSGLYALGRQAEAMQWNLERLAEALSPLCPQERLSRALTGFLPLYFRLSHRRFLQRLGVASRGAAADAALVARCLCFLEESRLGYDQFFFDWYGGVASADRAQRSPAAPSYTGRRFGELLSHLRDSDSAVPAGRLSQPYFEGAAPCTMLIDEIEALWQPIAARDDWSAFDAKIAAVRAMGQALRGPPAGPP